MFFSNFLLVLLGIVATALARADKPYNCNRGIEIDGGTIIQQIYELDSAYTVKLVTAVAQYKKHEEINEILASFREVHAYTSSATHNALCMNATLGIGDANGILKTIEDTIKISIVDATGALSDIKPRLNNKRTTQIVKEMINAKRDMRDFEGALLDLFPLPTGPDISKHDKTERPVGHAYAEFAYIRKGWQDAIDTLEGW